MTDRVPIQQAIDDAITEARRRTAERYSGGRLATLEAVKSGAIVTAERAALEAMAQHECMYPYIRERTQTCHDFDKADAQLCVPCWARHTLENPNVS